MNATPPATPGEVMLVVRHARLLDGNGTPPRSNMAAVIVDGKIAELIPEPISRDLLPVSSNVIEADGLTMMPGLIDAHQHIAGWEATPGGWLKDLTPYEALRAAANARQVLNGGITTIRDSGSLGFVDVAVARAVREGLVPGPRVIPSGYMILSAGSGEDGYFRPEVNVGRAEGVVTGAVEARRAVRKMLAMGAEAIKVIATGRVGSDSARWMTEPELELEEITAVVSESHRHSVMVDSHCIGLEGTRNAVRAGVDSVTHGYFLDDELVDEMFTRGTVLIPTIGVLQRLAEFEDTLPLSVGKRVKAAVSAQGESFSRALRRGVQIAMGSDGCNPYIPAGQAAYELECLVAHGMSADQAIVAGTRAAAIAVGLIEEVGTLERGKSADLLLVAGDPVTDIGVLRKADRTTVIQRGRVIRQASK